MTMQVDHPPPVLPQPLSLVRRLTARGRVLPDHLLIGAQKSGTTQLDHHGYLARSR